MSMEFLELLQSVEERRSPGRENSSWETVEHGADVKGEPLRWSDRENKIKQKTSKQTKNKNEKKITVKNWHTSTKWQSGGPKWLWLETLKDERDVLGQGRKLRNTGKNR